MMYRFQDIRENKTLQQTLRGAMEIRRLIREWFRMQEFVEVETPVLTRTPGQEPHLSVFETRAQTASGVDDAYFITSPEYALKKLLAAGFPKIFELARCFRNNEPTGVLHNPEFTMLEWYRADTDYQGIMNDVEQMVSWIARELWKIKDFDCKIKVDLTAPWERLSVKDAFACYASVDIEKEFERSDFEDWFFKTFLTRIEQKLGKERPTILYDYPACMAALARLKQDDPRYAERFEVYVNGIELANAFSELTDPDEQRKRFLHEQEQRKADGKPVYPLDESFLSALSEMPRCGGIALGVDRLAMCLLDAKSIHEVLFFPYS